ncbi:MAG TPA: hypothetical protein ENI15_02520 [Spirochaetes bacterium]|nr:hypothetical protein [Spirochaetota bacterium]
MDSILALMAVANFFHLFATVAWIGGMTTNMIILLPSAKSALDPPSMGKLMGAVMKRFRVLVYTSIVVLAITGTVITRFNRSYTGLFQFGDLWSKMALIKHIIIVIMIIIVIIAFEGIGKKAAKLAAKGPSPEIAAIQKKQIGLASFGFILGIIVLALTAIMSAVSFTY